jgi:type VI secretion system secreted protein Hcp
MAVDMFLKLDGIPGDSTDANHKDEIQIESFSWGVSNSSRVAAGSGGGAGKVAFQDFHFTASSSKASPNLMLACANGQHIKTATVTVRKAGQSESEFLKYTLTDVLVSGWADSSTSDGNPEDTFTLNFAKVVTSFSPTEPTGALAEPVVTSWNLSQVKID